MTTSHDLGHHDGPRPGRADEPGAVAARATAPRDCARTTDAPTGGPSPRVILTRDPDRAGTTLARSLALDRLTFVPAGDFAFRMVIGTCGALTVVTSHHSGEGLAETAPGREALVATLVLAGTATFRAGEPPHRLQAGEVWRLDTTRGLRLAHDAGATFADVVLPLTTVADAAAAAPGRDVDEDADGRPLVRFVTHRPLDDEAERYWAALTRATVQQVAGPRGAPTSPLLREHQVRVLATAALAVFPTVTVGRADGPGFTGPSTVRRAVEHLHAHAADPLTVADLAAAAGVGVRALQQAFGQHLGTSPLAYLQQVRLGRAHADLLAADPATGGSVADVAGRWGFAHLGRFAAAYRTRYGVAPSTTLRS